MTSALNARDDKRARKSQTRRASSPYSDQSTFINRELTTEETADLRTWREDVNQVDLAWGQALADGYKINTKRDDYNDCFAAFIIPGDGADNQGYILAGRGGTPYRAVAQGLYKHSVIFRGTWVPAAPLRGAEDDPDF